MPVEELEKDMGDVEDINACIKKIEDEEAQKEGRGGEIGGPAGTAAGSSEWNTHPEFRG